MKELDLHGLYHHQVRGEVENFVLLNSHQLPLRIITGYSDFMKQAVSEILNKYNFEFYIPSHNPGEVIVTYDKEHKI